MRTVQRSASQKQIAWKRREEITPSLDTNRPSIEFGQSRQFYILVLGQQNIRLLRGTRHTIMPIQLEGAPPDIWQALGEQLSDVAIQTYAWDAGKTNDEFGSSTPSNWQRNRILRYSRMVNWAVHRFLVGNQGPLIVAGTEFQRSIYHQVNTYPHLLGQDIVRPVECLADEDFHRLAWEIVEPLFRQAREQALERFRQPLSSGLTSAQAKLEAAQYRWVDPVIKEENQPVGMFYPKTTHLQESNEQSFMSAELISKAAAQAALNSVPLYVLPPQVLSDLPIVPAAS